MHVNNDDREKMASERYVEAFLYSCTIVFWANRNESFLVRERNKRTDWRVFVRKPKSSHVDGQISARYWQVLFNRISCSNSR